MHIAIDGRALTGRFTGDRTYWRNLLRVLPRLAPGDKFTVYSRTPIEPGELPDVPNLTYRVVPAANDRIWTFATLPRALRRDRPDLVHVQYTIPPACPCPVVTTIHDISFRLFPQWFPTRDRLLLNLTIPAAMRGAARIITDSDSSRDDILRAYRVAPSKVASIPLGLPPEFINSGGVEGERSGGEHQNTQLMQETAQQVVKTRYNLHEPFVLAVGVLQPRKNLRMLAQAFGKAKTAYGLPHSLVLAGKAGWDTEQAALRQAAAEGGGVEIADAIVFPGYVADEDLPHLYRACDAFAYPSLYEGFGFPPLEAMACGTPTLVSDAPPMPYNVGDAALVIAAKDVDAWAESLGRVLTDNTLRAELAAKGPSQAARFTWESTAERTLRVYQEVIKAGHAGIR
jgi:glycosyltransferase involved in cell wall biosynthesis